MKTSDNQGSKKRNKKNSLFWQIMGGDFLTQEKIVRTVYPYLAMLIAMLVVMILLEQRGEKKEGLIKQKQVEYRDEVNRLKMNNNFIPYEQNQALIQMMNERGFEKNDKHVYKIDVEND